MKPHRWEKHRDHPSAGSYFRCPDCGAYGGNTYDQGGSEPRLRPEYAHMPYAVQQESFLYDCDLARKANEAARWGRLKGLVAVPYPFADQVYPAWSREVQDILRIQDSQFPHEPSLEERKILCASLVKRAELVLAALSEDGVS